MPETETQNLPANQQPEQAAEAPKPKDRMEALIAAVEQRHEMLEKLLDGTGIGFDRFVEVFRRALIRGRAKPETDLLAADAASVIEACINAATDGLLPDGRQGAIVLYNTNVANKRRKEPDRWVKKAQWQPMYQGLLDIAYASGNFRSIEARVVYDGDSFEYELGDDAFIRHRPKPRPAGVPSPPIVAAYAVAKTVNGGVHREVFEGADIEKVNAVSKATNGPGKNWPEEMARKGPLRRMWKFLPKNEAMNRIVERDNEGFDLEQLDLPDARQAPPKSRLSPGFAAPPPPPAIEQGADMTVDIPMDQQMSGEDLEAGLHAPPGHPAADRAVQEMQRRAEIDKAVEGDDLPEGLKAATPPDVPDSGPGGVFEVSLKVATSWLNVKQALRSYRKSAPADPFDRIACGRAWVRMAELRAEGKDRTDFVTDPLLFECWLLGADPEPDANAVAGNWEIVQQDKAWAKLPEEDRERIATRVAEALSDGSA